MNVFGRGGAHWDVRKVNDEERFKLAVRNAVSRTFDVICTAKEVTYNVSTARSASTVAPFNSSHAGEVPPEL